MWRCFATAWSRRRTLYLLFIPLSNVIAAPPFVLRSDNGQMVGPLEAHLGPLW